MHKGLQSILQTVLLVCIFNGLILYIYLSGGGQKIIIPREDRYSSLSLKDILSNENATNAFINQSHITLRKKQIKIIYYKTHKTASTTVGNILFRLGAQHGARFLDYDKHYYEFYQDPPTNVDISLLHHRPMAFDTMMWHYKKMIPDGKFLTVVREPTRRYLSHFHYYSQPFGETFDEFLAAEKYKNYMAQDFGVSTTEQLDQFMAQAYNKFFVLVTEKLDESLLLLKNAWGWNLRDILYVRLNDACYNGYNYAKKPMSCTPQYGNLTAAQLQKMRENNKLDIALYERALNETNKKIGAQPQSFWDELALFKDIRSELQEKCMGKNKTFPEFCQPFRLVGLEYEAKIKQGHGKVANFPIYSVSRLS